MGSEITIGNKLGISRGKWRDIMKLHPLSMENIANKFVENLKKDFPKAHWSWTGLYNNTDGYIVIWDESDITDNWEWASPKYKMLDGGHIVPLETPVVKGIVKEYKDNYRIYKFGDRKIVAAYWPGVHMTSKSVMKMRPDGKYNVLYVNHLKGNVFSI